MKYLLAALLLIVSMIATATEIVAVGHGSTEESALLHAKQEATNQVVGSFLFGRTDIDGNSVRENIHQYNGGFVRKYEVLSSVVAHGVHEVAIRADVDADKINNVIVSTGKDVSPDAIDGATNADESAEKLFNVLHVLMNEKEKFATTVKTIEYKTHGATTRVTIKFDIVWSPKWYDDLYTAAKASGPELSNSADREFGVCFMGDKKFLYTPIECYDLHFNLNMSRDVVFDVYMGEGIGYSKYISNVSVNMNSLYYSGQFDPRQNGMFLDKNGVRHAEAVFDVPSKIVKHVMRFEIEIE
jgi:hypothetical protein